LSELFTTINRSALCLSSKATLVGEIKIFALALNADVIHDKNTKKAKWYLNKVVALKIEKLV